MAQTRKPKQRKVEARKIKPVIRFKLGVLLLLIFIAFAGCFALYMVSALSQEDYWETEIAGSSQQETNPDSTQEEPSAEPSTTAAVNPVPESPAADTSYLTSCAFLLDVTEFTTYCETASGMVFTDAISVLTEESMQSTAAQLAGKKPQAVYLWYSCPAEQETALTLLAQYAGILQGTLPGTPIYVLPALPEASDNRSINDWNTALFALAERMGLYYVDICTDLKGNDGTLAAAYSDPEAKFTTVRELLLTHIAD